MKPSTLLLAIAFLCVFAACLSPKEGPVPGHLVGTWRSTADKYSDSFLTITPSIITFGTEGQTANAFPIRGVRNHDEDSGQLYEIFYFTPEGDKQIFSFYYDGFQGGRIRLINQKTIVWTKQSS
jgi:hypothetical protein